MAARVTGAFVLTFLVALVVIPFVLQPWVGLMSGEHLLVGIGIVVNLALTLRVLQRLDAVTEAVQWSKARAAADRAAEAARRAEATAAAMR